MHNLLIQVGIPYNITSVKTTLNQIYSLENRDHSKTQAELVFGLANLAQNNMLPLQT